jgi:glyoxylase-like metal-dependent hydrolase (beta-lactamase superfamily II)
MKMWSEPSVIGKHIVLAQLCVALTGSMLLDRVALAQDAKTVLVNAAHAMGEVKSIQFTGTGHSGTLGQALKPGMPWPETNVTSYTRTIDYEHLASKEEITRSEPPNLRGGGAPFDGSQKQVNLVSGVPPVLIATAGCGLLPCWMTEERHLQIWLTPHGFLTGARANSASVTKTKDGFDVSFTVLAKYTVIGSIDKNNLITKTRTWIPNPVLGDMLVETSFSGYRDFNGVKFPSAILQTQGGHPVLDLAISDVRVDVMLDRSVPPTAVTQTAPAPAQVQAQKLADGLWWVGGGTHHSVLVEYPHYIAIIEAPLNEERSLAVIAEAKRLVPNKAIKYLVNTHLHFDHCGGIRTYVAEGATIITQAVNKAYYEQSFKSPHTMAPDRLSLNPTSATFITVNDKYTLREEGRLINIYHIENDNHNEGMLMVYLPVEKILVEADEFQPPPPNGPLPASRAVSFSKNLELNIERLKLGVQTIAPLHGYVLPYAELKKVVGKT